jgi:Domain of unknown function (DUF4365)
MLQFPDSPRKRRTRQHVIADQSVNHVERFIIDEGHTVTRMANDYGYDLLMMIFDETGHAETGLIFLQLKASETLTRSGENYFYDLDIRDYNLWKSERLPVILVLSDAEKRQAFWVHVQRYFENRTHRPRKKAKTIRVLISRKQVFNHKAFQAIRALKAPVTVGLVEASDE